MGVRRSRVPACLLLIAFGSIGLATSCGNTADDFISAYCDKLTPCCQKAGLGSAGTRCRLHATFNLFNTQGTYDPAAGRACLARLDKASATSTFCATAGSDAEAACLLVFSNATGTAAPGAKCTQSSDCAPSTAGSVGCAQGVDPSTGAMVQKCQVFAVGKAGSAPCVSTIIGSGGEPNGAWVSSMGYLCDLADGLYCNSTTNACAPLGGVGASCADNELFLGCVADTYCDLASKTCAARKAVGMSCMGPDDCVSGAHCDYATGACVALLAAGQPCNLSGMCAGGGCMNGKCSAISDALASVCDGSGSG